MSALQEACSGLLAAFKDTSQLRNRLAVEGRKLQASAQAAAAAARSAENSHAVMAVAQALQMAATRCNAAVQQIEAAEEAGKRFVQRTVGGAYGGSGGAPDDVAAWAGLDRGVSKGGVSGNAPTIDEIATWLPGVNPGFDGDPFNPKSSNCGSCALAVFARLSGDNGVVATTSTMSIREMESATGRTQARMTPSQIAERLVQGGPGSHAVVGVDRQFGDGHWFNAYFDGERVVAIDGQTGEVRGWPPTYGSNSNPVVYWDAGVS